MKDSIISSKNNYDFLRLLFSTAVIFSHSYPLTGKDEIFVILSNGQLSLGGLAVEIFFTLSGYLIFISLINSKSIKNYLWKRILRLYPALILLVLFTMVILPFLYTGKSSIFSERQYWTYGPNLLSLYRLKAFVIGVFENNPFMGAINSSLWTLRYEFTMYLLLILTYPLKNKKRLLLITLVIIFITCNILNFFQSSFLSIFFSIVNLGSQQMYRLTTYFLAGVLLTFVNLKKINTLRIRIILLFLILLSLYINVFNIVSPILVPILVMLTGQLNTKYINSIRESIGDISYGVYIYGFLVQQCLMNFFNLGVIELTLYSIFITYILAYFSWHIVEKPTQRYKNIF